jgi:hypothetical protein
MRFPTSLLLAASLLATAAPAVAETIAPGGQHLIPGLYDPKTGTFRPVTPNTFVNPETTIVRSGTFLAKFTITVKSNIPTAPIYVTLDANTDEVSSSYGVNVFDESATVQATRSGAGAASATVAIPFSWHLATPTKDVVSLSYTITAGAYTAGGTTVRSSSQVIATLLGVPNGASEVVSAVI